MGNVHNKVNKFIELKGKSEKLKITKADKIITNSNSNQIAGLKIGKYFLKREKAFFLIIMSFFLFWIDKNVQLLKI